MVLIFGLLLIFQGVFCDPFVKLPQGDLQGTFKKSYNGKIFQAFEGIPYAKPPLGNLRFEEPIPADNWDGILIANKNTSCPQLTDDGNFFGSEDCLHLNVYVPKTNPKKQKYVVIVHIHGGTFVKNSGFIEAQPDYIMDKDLILVTLNHRLGALGFLSTDDAIIPGNNGLKDQNLALKWVKNNIGYFGGNPDNVTLTGFSSGGASVHYHLLSPLSIGLFKRAYSISGTALYPRSFQENPMEITKKIAEKFICPTNNSRLMKECLKRVPVENLTGINLKWAPSIEKQNKNPFLPDHPYKLIIDKKIIDVPWITTNVADEAYFLLDSIYKDKKAVEIIKNWDVEGAKLLQLNNKVEDDKMAETLEKIKEKYFGHEESEDLALYKLSRVMTDRFFFFPEDLVLRKVPFFIKSPVYYAIFSFVPEDHIQCGKNNSAASHCVDARLLYKPLKTPKKLQSKGEKMMFLMTDFLETYAKTGIPKLDNENWLPINASADFFNVLNIISPENIKMTAKKELVCRKFWESLPIIENDHLY